MTPDEVEQGLGSVDLAADLYTGGYITHYLPVDKHSHPGIFHVAHDTGSDYISYFNSF